MCRLNEKIFPHHILKDMTVSFALISPWRCWQGILVKTAQLNCAGFQWEHPFIAKPSKFTSAAEKRYSIENNNDIKKVLQ
jgi:hypothetical protein